MSVCAHMQLLVNCSFVRWKSLVHIGKYKAGTSLALNQPCNFKPSPKFEIRMYNTVYTVRLHVIWKFLLLGYFHSGAKRWKLMSKIVLLLIINNTLPQEVRSYIHRTLFNVKIFLMEIYCTIISKFVVALQLWGT